MSSDIYQERIKQLAQAAVGDTVLEPADVIVDVDNPLCGDSVRLSLRLRDQHIAALGHRVRGCLLCRAAASVIGAVAVGSDEQSVQDVRQALTALFSAGATQNEAASAFAARFAASPWCDLVVFAPVAAHKSRHQCVLLPFDALVKALTQSRAGGGAT